MVWLGDVLCGGAAAAWTVPFCFRGVFHLGIGGICRFVQDDILLRQAIEASLKEFAPPGQSSWLDDTDDEEESMIFRRRLGGDSSGISEGLLRAFELSQQLLMQQTEGISSSFQSEDTQASQEMKELIVDDSANSPKLNLSQLKSDQGTKILNVDTENTDMSMDIDFDQLFHDSSKLESSLAKRDCKKRERTHESKRGNSDLAKADCKRNKDRSRVHAREGSNKSSRGERYSKSLRPHKNREEGSSHSLRTGSLHVRTPHSTKSSADRKSEKMSKVNLDLCHELESEFERIREEMKKVQGQVTELVAEHQNVQKKELGARKKERANAVLSKTGSKSEGEGESEDGCKKMYEQKLSKKWTDDAAKITVQKSESKSSWKRKSSSSETDVCSPVSSKIKDDSSPWKLRDEAESSASWPSSPKRSPRVCRKITSSLYPDTKDTLQSQPQKTEDVWQRMSDLQIEDQQKASKTHGYLNIKDTITDKAKNEESTNVEIQMDSRSRGHSNGRNHESEWPLHEDNTSGWQMYI